MGDISELRGLLFGVSLLGIFTVLVLSIPPQLTYAPEIQNRTSVPNTYDPSDTFYYTENATIMMSNSSTGADFTIGGRSCTYDGWTDSGVHYFALGHYEGSWGMFKWGFHPMTIYDKIGMKISIEKLHMGGELGKIHQAITPAILDNLYIQNVNLSVRTYAKCDHFQMTEVFTWNISAYSLPSQAWQAGYLQLVLLIKFDQVNTSFNAWDLLGMVLFFQLPSVHPVVNFIIALPLWVTFAYVIAIIILRIIGAVFGGGA